VDELYIGAHGVATKQDVDNAVPKDKIIATIEASGEDVRISAKHITLEGATIAEEFTAENLTITGNSVFKGTLDGATGNFSGNITATSIAVKKECGIYLEDFNYSYPFVQLKLQVSGTGNEIYKICLGNDQDFLLSDTGREYLGSGIDILSSLRVGEYYKDSSGLQDFNSYIDIHEQSVDIFTDTYIGKNLSATGDITTSGAITSTGDITTSGHIISGGHVCAGSKTAWGDGKTGFFISGADANLGIGTASGASVEPRISFMRQGATATQNQITIDSSKRIEITGGFQVDGDIVLHNNNKSLYGRNTSGDLRTLIGVDSSNHVKIGNNNSAVYIYGGNYSLHYVQNGTDKTVSTSDKRVKRNIQSLESLEEFFDNLRPVSYNRVDWGEKLSIGFLADDIKENASNTIGKDLSLYADEQIDESLALYYNNFLGEETLHSGDVLKGLEYREFVALNTHMLQKTRKELQSNTERIEELEAENKRLKKRIEVLEAA
jgi:hypothetical protein